MKKIAVLFLFTTLLFQLPQTASAQEEEDNARNGFFLKPVGTYNLILNEGGGSLMGGGLLLGGNFARGWVGGIQGGATYEGVISDGVSGGIVDIIFEGIFGWSVSLVDLYFNVGIDWPVTTEGDFFMGVRAGGNVDFWILKWLALGGSANIVWAYDVVGLYNSYYGYEINDISRFTIQFGPKFRF